MRVLIHSHVFHPRVGGCQTFVDALACGLSRLGFGVRLATSEPLRHASEIVRPYEVVRLTHRAEGKAMLAHVDVFIDSGPSVRLVYAATRRRIPMVLIHHGAHASYSAMLEWGKGINNLKDLARVALLRWAMARAARNVFVSRHLQNRVVGQDFNAPSASSVSNTVIWNGFDPAIYSPAPSSDRELSTPENSCPESPFENRNSKIENRQCPIFTFAGRLVSEKGIDIIVRAFSLARNSGLNGRLRIIGEGPLSEETRRLAESLGVAGEVEFLPFQSPTELARMYRESYAVLFPSRCEETFGLVVIEAMACGCPVIASNRGAPPEIIDDTGILVPADEPTTWANTMLTLAAQPARRSALAQASAQRAHRLFSLSTMIERYRELMESSV